MDQYNITIATYNRVARDYEAKFMDNDIYKKSYNVLYELINMPSPRILDIACGPAIISKYLLSKLPTSIISGIDGAPEMVELARKNIPDGVFQVMDCRNLSLLEGEFDVIISGFATPYLSKIDTRTMIKTLALLLSQEGIFYLSTMEGKYEDSGWSESSSNPDNKVFIYYHEENYIKEYFEENGLSVLNVIKQNYPESDGKITVDMIFIAKKIN